MVLVVSFNTATFSLYLSLSTVKIIFMQPLVNCFLSPGGHQQLLLFLFCKLNRYLFFIGWRICERSKIAMQCRAYLFFIPVKYGGVMHYGICYGLVEIREGGGRLMR